MLEGRASLWGTFVLGTSESETRQEKTFPWRVSIRVYRKWLPLAQCEGQQGGGSLWGFTSSFSKHLGTSGVSQSALGPAQKEPIRQAAQAERTSALHAQQEVKYMGLVVCSALAGLGYLSEQVVCTWHLKVDMVTAGVPGLLPF